MADNQLNYKAAQDLLINNIFTPVFFEKLAADYGIQPSNEAEAREFLLLAGKLQHVYESQQTKQANERSSWISAASKHLDKLMGSSTVSMSDINADMEVKQAAAQLSQVPEIRNAALLFQDSMRQMMADK